jgi:hypothetical protein
MLVHSLTSNFWREQSSISLGALAFLADAYDISVDFREVRLTEICEMASHRCYMFASGLRTCNDSV